MANEFDDENLDFRDEDLDFDDDDGGNGNGKSLSSKLIAAMEDIGVKVPGAGEMDLEELVRHLITALSTIQKLRGGQADQQDDSEAADDGANQYTTMSRQPVEMSRAESVECAKHIMGVKPKPAADRSRDRARETARYIMGVK